MTPLRQRMIEDMQSAISRRTRNAHIQYRSYCRKSPDLLGQPTSVPSYGVTGSG